MSSTNTNTSPVVEAPSSESASLSERQLHGFHLARQLHLVAQFEQTVTYGALVCPIFHFCLRPEVQAAAQADYAVLQEVLKARLPCLSVRAGVPSTDAAKEAAHYAPSVLSQRILSFLDYEELLTSLSERVSSTTAETQGNIGSEASTALPEGEGEGKNALSSSLPAARRPAFYVVPPLHSSKDSSDASRPSAAFTTGGYGGGYHKTSQIFVRLIKDCEFEDEVLNTYFGRYGMVSSSRCRMVHLLDSGFSPLTVDLLASSFQCHPSQLLLQDYWINLDSSSNAIMAVHRAYFKELLFIALSDPVFNHYTAMDVDVVLQSVVPQHLAPVRPSELVPEEAVRETDGRGMVGEESLALSAEAMKNKTRKRRRSFFGSGHDIDDSGLDNDSTSSSDDSGSSFFGSERSGSSSFLSTDGSAPGESKSQTFVPDVVLHGFPYWITAEQIKWMLEPFGVVCSFELSIDDRTGVFTGAVLVRMATAMEALQLSTGLHGAALPNGGGSGEGDGEGGTEEGGSEDRIVAGIVQPDFSLVSLLTGELLLPATHASGMEPLIDGGGQANDRLWV